MNLNNVILILKILAESFFGHYLCINGGFDESKLNAEKSESSLEKALLEM